MEACERALERGVFAQAIRPPTVPDGTSRLRLAVMASHTLGRAAPGRAACSARWCRTVPRTAAGRSASAAGSAPRVFDGLAEAA